MAECQYNLDVSSTLGGILGFLNLLQGIAAALGNLLVFVTIIRNKRLRTRSNAFLLSLAASDLLVGCIVEPMHVIQFFSTSYRTNCGFNKVRRYLSTVFMGAAIGSIALVSYDRWTHLKRTLNYDRYMTKGKVVILLLIVWAIPAFVPLVRLTSEVIYSTIILIYVLAAVSLMISCYFIIIKMVRKRERALISGSKDPAELRREAKNHIRAGKAIALVIVVLLVTFLPISIYHGITAINGFSKGAISISANTKEICYAILMTIGMANSGVNPIIYYLRMPDFRASFAIIFRCLKRGGQTKSSDYEMPETSLSNQPVN